PASWDLAVAAKVDSGGKINAVTDTEITEAFKLLPRKEGIFAEPGSCASIAGVIQQCKEGSIAPGSKVVAVLTGNGLKDPQTAMDQVSFDLVSLPKEEEAVMAYIEDLVQE